MMVRARASPQIHAKLEGDRCGLGSFKALGGALAVAEAAEEAAATARGGVGGDGGGGDGTRLTFATASAGNHGVAVAWGARRVGAEVAVAPAPRPSESERVRGRGDRSGEGVAS